jgi:NADH oxidase (H2O2-forming)
LKNLKSSPSIVPLGISVVDEQHILIIGCGAAGGTAAQFARKTNRKAHITIIEKGPHPHYSKCGLPYAISRSIPSFSDLIEFSIDWFTKANIQLLLNTTVAKINHTAKTITITNNKTTNTKPYHKLIIATGADPTIPPIPGLVTKRSTPKGVHVLRTIEHGKSIQKYVQKGKPVIIIGAGLIGLEMADALTKLGMKVTVIEALPTILTSFLDPDMAQILHQHLQQHITLHTNHLVQKIETQNDAVNAVHILNKETKKTLTLPASQVIIATGIQPNTQLAQKLGCQIGTTGGIKINNKTETSINNIYAIGDCTEYPDFITQKPVPIGLGSIVIRQGIAAGVNAAGGTYDLPPGVLLTRTSEFFGLEIAGVGPTTSQIKPQPVNGRFSGSSLPDYFPGGKSITMKINIHPLHGTIQNAQAVGENTAQRINVYASAILKKMTVEEFRRLETAYAPPIAPTLDVLTLTADVASLKQTRRR